MSVNGSLKIEVALNDRTTTSTTGTATETISETYTYSIANGTGANQANKIWSVDFSLTATSVTYDLTSLTGPKGTVTFTKIKGLSIYNASTTDGATLTVGNAASNVWSAPFSGSTATVKVMASGQLILVSPLAQSTNPWTVDSSNKNLKLDSGASTITGTLIVWGT